MIDAHVHIERGPYTLAWLNQFVEQAVKNGITEIRFLEHSFRFYEFRDIYRGIVAHPKYGTYQGDWLNKRCAQTLDSYKTLIAAARNTAFPIKVKFGLEVCYFEGMERETSAVLSGFNWDFLTGAVHWIDGWGFDHKETKDEWRLADGDALSSRYYETMIHLVESRLFTCLAHPDSFKCFGYSPKSDFSLVYNKLAAALNSSGMETEISCGLKLNYGLEEIGPCKPLLAALRFNRVKLVTASDAHTPLDSGRFIDQATICKRQQELSESI